MTNEPSAMMKMRAERDELLESLRVLIRTKSDSRCANCLFSGVKAWHDARELVSRYE